MRTILKAAIVAFGVAGALAAVPASAQPYDYPPYPYDGYYGQDYDAYGADCDPYYGCPDCDPYYGCPDDYYDMPLYYGQVFYDGFWSDGPFYYRDWGGHRQFWIRGAWRDGNYRGGHFGPALGRAWYQNHGGRGFTGVAPRQAWGNQNWNRQGFRRSDPPRAQTFQNRSFQAQPGGGWSRGNGGWHGAPQAQAAPRGNGGGGHWGGGSGGHWSGGHHR